MKTGQTHQARENHSGDQLTAATSVPPGAGDGREASRAAPAVISLPSSRRVILLANSGWGSGRDGRSRALASSRLIGTQVTAVTWLIPPCQTAADGSGTGGRRGLGRRRRGRRTAPPGHRLRRVISVLRALGYSSAPWPLWWADDQQPSARPTKRGAVASSHRIAARAARPPDESGPVTRQADSYGRSVAGRGPRQRRRPGQVPPRPQRPAGGERPRKCGRGRRSARRRQRRRARAG